MDILSNLMHGFATVLTPFNLWMAVTGLLLRHARVGILPGLGPSATIAMLIPLTFGMNPIPAMIMMCAIYYGAMYGGSTTSILLNVPGESASVVTCIDGYQMARQGRARRRTGNVRYRLLCCRYPWDHRTHARSAFPWRNLHSGSDRRSSSA